MTTKHQSVRAARDNLIDLLDFGYTYPITDLTIRDEQLKVPFDASADIPIETSQQGVLYRLHSRLEQPIPNEDIQEDFYEIEGNGEDVLLTTPKISEDITYKIWARKCLHEEGWTEEGRTDDEENRYVAYLGQTAEIKVGLDAGLVARILDGDILDIDIGEPTPEAARIIYYNETVRVELLNSQEGVEYQLVTIDNDIDNDIDDDVETVLSGSVTGLGSGNSVTLTSTEVAEDIDIRIRATKTFDQSEGREDETALLDTVLPLRVRADKDLAVFVGPADSSDPSTPQPVVDYLGTAVINIVGAQAGVGYRLYIHAIADAEIVFDVDSVPAAKLLNVNVPENPDDVAVVKPLREHYWRNPPQGYTEIGSPQTGAGERISFALPDVEVDSLIVVKAQKQHNVGDKTIPSAIQLQQPVAFVVRAPTKPSFTLTNTGHAMVYQLIRVTGAAGGVYYHIRGRSDGDEIGLPAYFHKWATEARNNTRNNRRKNKGVNALRVGVDFVVTDDDSPKEPILDVTGITNNTELHIQAVKAMTRVMVNLNASVVLPAVTAIRVKQAEVVEGAVAEFVIEASRPAAIYQLLLNGDSVGDPLIGNGNTLELRSQPVNENTQFTVRATHDVSHGFTVNLERRIAVAVKQE